MDLTSTTYSEGGTKPRGKRPYKMKHAEGASAREEKEEEEEQDQEGNIEKRVSWIHFYS